MSDKHKLTLDEQVRQARSVKALTAENSRLRAERDKAEALGFRRGVEASAKVCEELMADHAEKVRGQWHTMEYEAGAHHSAMRIRALLPKDSP